MLDSWQQVYLQVREKIEVSGRDARWEFDRKQLFSRPLMSPRSVETSTLSRSWMSSTSSLARAQGCDGRCPGLDEVTSKVHMMIKPLETIDFNVFDRFCMSQWKNMFAKFLSDKEHIEQAPNLH